MSDENDIITETTRALGLGPAAHEFYKDTLQDACQEIGPNLHLVARAVTLAMSPFQGAVWGLEEIRDWLAVKLTEKLAHEDPDRITAPKMSIAGPALLNLHFCKDEEELRDMYATLLASSMNENCAGQVHPSFVHMIQQLSADEARILQWIALHHANDELFAQKLDDDGSLVGTKYLDASFRELCKKAASRLSL